MLFPDLSFTDHAGKAQKLSQFRGKYVIIDLWATWCQPCLEIRPAFEARERSYKYYQNIKFISISVDQDQQRWKNFLKPNHQKHCNGIWLILISLLWNTVYRESRDLLFWTLKAKSTI